MRQIHMVGVKSTFFISMLAILVGAVAVIQASIWQHGLMEVDLVNPFLVVVVARELGPLFVNLVVFAKDGSAITSEVGSMKLSGEVKLLEAQGIDPLTYLILPKMWGAVIAALSLTVIFIGVAFLSGFFVGTAIGHVHVSLEHFYSTMLRSLSLDDWGVLLVKSILPAALQNVICATLALQISSPAELPTISRLAATRSLGALFLVTSITSLVVYG
ncbi:MAG: ABC transporter permease [Limisphaerales bacterium]